VEALVTWAEAATYGELMEELRRVPTLERAAP